MNYIAVNSEGKYVKVDCNGNHTDVTEKSEATVYNSMSIDSRSTYDSVAKETISMELYGIRFLFQDKTFNFVEV